MDAEDYAPEGVKRMPDGPALPETGIQRGTLKDGLGDPSTYLYPSTSKYLLDFTSLWVFQLIMFSPCLLLNRILTC